MAHGEPPVPRQSNRTPLFFLIDRAGANRGELRLRDAQVPSSITLPSKRRRPPNIFLIKRTGVVADLAGPQAQRKQRFDTEALLTSRAHGAITKGLRLSTIAGSPPDLSALPPGCAFAERCRFKQDICEQRQPPQQTVNEGHLVRCIDTAIKSTS